MRTHPSQADEELTEAIRKRGAPWVKASQVQAWHEYGVFSSSQRWLGRGKGSVSDYSPETAELVARFAQLVRLLRSIDAATIWLFLEDSPLGERIRERGLRRALKSLCAIMPAPSEHEPATQAEAMATSAARDRSLRGRALAGFLGARGLEPKRRNIYRDIALTALGQPAPVDPSVRRGTPLAVRSFHLDEEWANDARGVAQVLNSRMSTASRGSLEQLVESATLGDLRRARVSTGLIPPDVIEQIKPGLRKSCAALVAGVLLSRVRDEVFEREAVMAKT